VQVEQATRLPGLSRREGVDDIHRLVARLRWQLAFERLLVAAIRGAAASAVALAALATAAWFTRDTPISTGLAAAPVLAALALAVVRWPSHRDATLAADRRLGLEDRLTTALELVRGHKYGRFDELQIRDAVQRARATPRGWLTLDGRFRYEAALAIGLLALGVSAAQLLPALPRPVSPAPAPIASALDSEAQEELTQQVGAVPADPLELAPTDTQPIQRAQSAADLGSRVQQDQAERSALDSLAQALGSVSAGQGVADAIQQGDFNSARSQLQNLGEEADQVSDAAKQQLARALQQAAGGTAATDHPLSDRERQAAQALSRSSYADQRQTLRNLADQVERSGARSVSADELAREQGQLQQQQGGATGARGQVGAGGQPAPDAQRSSAAQGQQGPGTGAGADGEDLTAAGGQAGGAAAGQQGGAGVGAGTNPDVLGNQPQRLDAAGQQVQVPTKLGRGPGVRPPDGTEDQSAADANPGGQTVSELAQAQQTGQVSAEQNLVPGEQRPIVRGYFR
jgi:hypothetical protein